jgi:hypothetical protein
MYPQVEKIRKYTKSSAFYLYLELYKGQVTSIRRKNDIEIKVNRIHKLDPQIRNIKAFADIEISGAILVKGYRCWMGKTVCLCLCRVRRARIINGMKQSGR